MKKLLLTTALVGSTFAIPAQGSYIATSAATSSPCSLQNQGACLTAMINGTAVTLNPTVTSLSNTSFRLTFNYNQGGTTFSGHADLNTDPDVFYNVAFANGSSAPESFTLLVSSPFVGGPYTSAYSTQSGSVTDANGDGSVSVTPISTDIQNPSFGSDPTGGASDTAFGAVVGGCSGAVVAHSSTVCGVTNIFGIPVVSPASGYLVINVGAVVSAGDSYAATGDAGFSAPEPATYALMTAALGLLGFARRKR